MLIPNIDTTAQISSESGARKHFALIQPSVQIEYLAFDGELHGQEIYEIWYMADREYSVSFVTFDSSSGYGYCDSIGQLLFRASKVGSLIDAKMQVAGQAKFRLYVASAAFLLSLITLLFIAVNKSSDQRATIIAAIVGVVSSGALFFFGAWVPGGLFRKDNVVSKSS